MRSVFIVSPMRAVEGAEQRTSVVWLAFEQEHSG